MALSGEVVKGLVGLALADAESRVAARGSDVTVMPEDGVSFPALATFDPDRVCFHVEKGKVTAATVG